MIDYNITKLSRNQQEKFVLPVIRDFLNRSEGTSFEIPQKLLSTSKIPFLTSAELPMICCLFFDFYLEEAINQLSKMVERFLPKEIYIVIFGSINYEFEEQIISSLADKVSKTSLIDLDELEQRIQKFPDLQERLSKIAEDNDKSSQGEQPNETQGIGKEESANQNFSKTTVSENSFKLKHALSVENEDKILIEKGYSNQGLVGYLYSKKLPKTNPLYQEYIDEWNDYFYFIDRDSEDISNFETSEKKTIGYLATESDRLDLGFARYFNKKTYDHFYCVNPNRKLLSEWNYTEEKGKEFFGSFLLSEPDENRVQLFVYSTNPELKLFTSPVLEKRNPEIAAPEAPPFLQEDIQRMIDLNIAENKDFWWLNAISTRWSMNSLNVGDYEEYTAIGKSGRYVQYAKDLKKGDLAIGCQGEPDQKIIGICQIEKEYKENDRIGFRLIDKFPSQKTLEQLNHDDLFRNSPLARNLAGSFKKVSYGLFYRLAELGYSPPKDQNEQKNTAIDNDGAFTTNDLLDIENDVRSFALILASENVKPPLAIALFGKWGLGKSFFMKLLQQRVKELSEHQGFLKEKDEQISAKEDQDHRDIFCKGIAQIEFNAWSYLDANLWAGLVSSIFEKLDEYISDLGKGEKEILEIRKKLSQKLEVLSEEKEIALKTKKDLESDRTNIEKEINRLESEKEQIIEAVANKKLEDLIDDVKKEATLPEEVKTELANYGITEEQIQQLSPGALYNEFNSWVTFIKNLGQFSPTHILLFTFCAIVFVAIWIDPGNYISDYLSIASQQITALIAVLGPLFIKWYSSFSNFKKLIKPVTDFRNDFNRRLEEAKFKHQQEIDLLEIKLKSNENKIKQEEDKLNDVSRKIEHTNYIMDNFIAKRAFNNFVQRTSSGEKYRSHLGLISIIRKDLETLSELFHEVDVDNRASISVKKQQADKKKEYEELSKLFKDEKTLDRIILYIDDLDRCSDEKVLEVIQAVHLLMAFPLFNVVVGVDKRCVRNALLLKTKLEYRKIAPLKEIEDLGIHMISPAEYLEKIFQIPFELREPEPKDFKALTDHLLKSQIEEKGSKEEREIDLIGVKTKERSIEEKKEEVISDEDAGAEEVKEETLPGSIEETSETKEEEMTPSDEDHTPIVLVSSAPDNLMLSQLEVDQIKDILFLVGNTPRTIKRFINIYRIIRAHKRPEMEMELKKQDYLAIMFLLAIGIGEYKFWRDEIYLLLLRHPTYQLNTVLKKIEGKKEFEEETKQLKIKFNEIGDHKKIKEVLKMKGAQFVAHIPFLTRFSFGEEITSSDHEIKSA